MAISAVRSWLISCCRAVRLACRVWRVVVVGWWWVGKEVVGRRGWVRYAVVVGWGRGVGLEGFEEGVCV